MGRRQDSRKGKEEQRDGERKEGREGEGDSSSTVSHIPCLFFFSTSCHATSLPRRGSSSSDSHLSLTRVCFPSRLQSDGGAAAAAAAGHSAARTKSKLHPSLSRLFVWLKSVFRVPSEVCVCSFLTLQTLSCGCLCVEGEA